MTPFINPTTLLRAWRRPCRSAVQAERDSGPDSARNRAFFIGPAATALHSSGDRTAPRKRERSFTTCCAARPGTGRSAAAQKMRMWPIGWALAFQAGQRGFDSPHPLQFGCVRAPGAHDRPRERLGAMCWITALAQRANRVGMHHFPRSGTAELDHRPGDGTGIRACLRNRILGVRLSPGAPAIR